MLWTTWKATVLVQGQMVTWATVSIVMDRSKEIQHMEGRWGGFVSGLSGLAGGVFLDGDTQERSLAWIWMCGLGRLWSQPDVWSLKLWGVAVLVGVGRGRSLWPCRCYVCAPGLSAVRPVTQ